MYNVIACVVDWKSEQGKVRTIFGGNPCKEDTKDWHYAALCGETLLSAPIAQVGSCS
jgi:hypothetical protein